MTETVSTIVNRGLTESTQSIRIQTPLEGGVIELIMRPGRNPLPDPSNEVVHARWMTSAVDAYYPVSGLLAGQWIAARQVIGGQGGGISTAIEVRPTAAPVTDPVFNLGQLYSCSTCVHLWGTTPGARVTVKAGATAIGSGLAPSDGLVRIVLTRLLQDGDAMSVDQEAAGATHTTIGPVVQRLPASPRAPTVRQPLYEYQREVAIDGILQNANVKLFVDGALAASGCSAGLMSDTVSYRLPWLDADRQIATSQDFSDCQWRSPLSMAVAVRSEPPQAPTIRAVCTSSYDDGVHLDLAGLVSGATVQLHVTRTADGKVEQIEFIARAPDGIADARYLLRALPDGTLTARQGLADPLGVVHKWSDDSKPVTLNRRTGHPLTRPEIDEPIYECARAIQVYGPVGVVHVRSVLNDREIAVPTTITDLLGRVEVLTEPLRYGDTIEVTIEACDGTRSPAARAVVQPRSSAALVPPEISGLLSVAGRFRPVIVSHVTPGAVVTLSLNNVEIPGISLPFAVAARAIDLPHTFELHAGDVIRVRQTLCDSTTLWSTTKVDVVA